MKTNLSKCVLVLFVGASLTRLCLAAPAIDPVERAFEAGNSFAEKGQFAKALEQYRIVLKAAPDEPSVLWNAGSAAYSTGDYKTASTLFARLQTQEPNNGHLLSKRMQTAQELGDLKTRDILRTRLFALHKSGKDSTKYASRPSYCRDQFYVGKDLVFVFEFFDLKPFASDGLSLGRRFDFQVMAPDESQKMRVECGWSSLDKTKDGRYIPSKELPAFYYDAYYPSGPDSRLTFGLGPTEPPFEVVKAQVLAIMSGKAKPVSGQRRDDSPATNAKPDA